MTDQPSTQPWNEVVTEASYPHGLRCMDCQQEVLLGERVYEREAGPVEEALAHVPNYDDTPAFALVCASCRKAESDD